jgi:hypothetical protein
MAALGADVTLVDCVFETHDTGTGNNDFFRDAA